MPGHICVTSLPRRRGAAGAETSSGRGAASRSDGAWNADGISAQERAAGRYPLARAKGEIWIVEVKSGVPDFRSDHKWQDYLEWCDRFFFAVGPTFPTHILPAEAGLLIADEYDAVLIREPETVPLPGGRRKALTLRFAHLAARRLSGRDDPIQGL